MIDPKTFDGLVGRLRGRVQIETACGNRTENPNNHVRLMDEAADTLSLMRRERDDAYAAMRWVYDNGMVPHPTRPQWVSDAFNEAFAPIRAANSRSATNGK